VTKRNGAAIPAGADSAVEIRRDLLEADADLEMTRRKAFTRFWPPTLDTLRNLFYAPTVEMK